MNIFAIDEDAEIAAKHLMDIHVNKMVLESSQLIANCFSSEVLGSAPKTLKGTVRKHSYLHHPCSIWTKSTKANLRWLIRHSLAMERERLDRGFNPHFSARFLRWSKDNIEKSYIPEGELQPFTIAISEDSECRKVFKFDSLNPVIQYRLYYKMDKPHLADWKQNKPEWYDLPIKEILK